MKRKNLLNDPIKVCRVCGVILTLKNCTQSMFNSKQYLCLTHKKEYDSAWRNKNRNKIREKNKIYREKNYDKCKQASLKFHYGATLEEFKLLYKKSKGMCKICGSVGGNTKHTCLHIDHNHKTNKIRGLLCPNCNRAIGLFKENPNLLSKAIEYLKKIDNTKI